MLLAAVPHLENSYYFLGSIYAYKLVAPGIGQMVAIVLPLMQLVIAVLLNGRIFADAVNVIAMLLFAVFCAVQSFAYFGGLDISCGCFGPGHDTPIGWFSLSLVYGLLTLSVIRNAMVVFLQSSDCGSDTDSVNHCQSRANPV
jgi:hypothetical protein